MTDVWTERIKAFTEFGSKLGFAAMAFFSILFCVMWWIGNQQELERDRIAIDKMTAEAHVATLGRMSENAEEQREDFKRVLEFTKGTEDYLSRADAYLEEAALAHSLFAAEQERASEERTVLLSTLKTLVEHICDEGLAKNEPARPDTGGP